MKNIAILGSTSHIAKGIVKNFLNEEIEENILYLFCRNVEKMKKFLKEIKTSKDIKIFQFCEFNNNNYDVIINCVGAGTPKGYSNLTESILLLTEKYDNLILEYLKNKKDTLYINFSSGAIYGKGHENPMTEETLLTFDINGIGEKDSYLISKLNSECKHRTLKNLNIVDLRVFSYFSEFIDLEANYLITDILKAVVENKGLKTNSNDLTRDYVSNEDLFKMIKLCIDKKQINDFFDVYSKNNISKNEILESFKLKYNLEIILDEEKIMKNTSGTKNVYYSLNKKAERILGYVPKFSSEECILNGTEKLFRKLRKCN